MIYRAGIGRGETISAVHDVAVDIAIDVVVLWIILIAICFHLHPS